MKKYLLFIISMLCVSIGTWAAVTYDGNKSPDGAYAGECGSFTTTAAGDLNTDKTSLLTNMSYYKTIFIVGPVNEDDIKALNDYSGSNDIIVDLTRATGLNADWLVHLANAKITGLGLPDGFDLGLTNENLKVVYSTAATGSKTYGGDSKGGDSYKVNVLASGGLTQITDNYFKKTYYHKFRTFDVYGSANYTDAEMTEFMKLESIGAVTEIATYGGGDDPYIVSGCNVTIQMGKVASGQTLSDQIALAKAAVVAGGNSNICTLTVTGEINDNDLIALGGTNMTGATRIDLSGATLASNVTIDYLQIPATLESLVLTPDQTVSVGLAAKLAAVTTLNYAYSPSSDSQKPEPASTGSYDDSKNRIADYVWIVKAGGLAEAFTNETQLRNSFYIKVASEVALNATDVDFNGLGANKPTNYLFLDFSDSNLTPATAAQYTVTDNIGYRIILPDDWSADEMAVFAALPQEAPNETPTAPARGNLAAVYSYSGTTLKIMEIVDGSYMTTALANPRIVRSGTTAIMVVSGTYNDTKYGNFGQTSTTTNNLLAAINGAASSIKSVTITDVTTATDEPLTFTNTNLTSITLDRVKSSYDNEWGISGPIVNVNSCTALTTLNLIDCQLKSVTAQGSSLTSVNLNGTGVDGDTNLSTSGLRTLTTNSSTELHGDLNLKSTASYTSFTCSAKLGTTTAGTGNIYLNASGVTSVDLQNVQFQNTTSKIHIDNTAEESETVLSNLNAENQTTISVPNGFDKTRLHPYSSETLDDNIAEAAASGSFEDSCDPKCRIDYDADAKTATVYAYTPEHFKALMEASENYKKFAAGTIFTFDASCKLDAADLAALAGDATNGNYNKFFVDLYNLPASYEYESTSYNYETIISDAIGLLRTNNWQYKSLLLPKSNENLGTTLIQDRDADATKIATCSESIAYSGTIGETTTVLTASYIYKAADDYGIDYQARLLNLEKMMDLHDEIVTKTQYYSVSTNSATPLDLSTIPAEATVNESTINTSKLETVNNDMVTSTSNKPSIYAYPAYEDVMLDVMTSSGIGNTTNLELLMVDGPLTAGDIASVNSFTDGPRVLDLREAEVDGGITKVMLESITNANIEYIILPEGMTKDVVCGANYSSDMTKLKAVISSTSTNLIAYVNTPGSLAEARYYATGGTTDGTIFNPTLIGLQSVTLAGHLNASDIAANTTNHYLDENGHWTTTSGNLKSVALWGEQGTITTIDLKDAVFAEQTDMNFSYAGLASLHDIILPTSNEMTLIPAECFMGITTFNDLCIPYNYKKIDNAALLNAYCGHITTTDANGALIDNGEHSYTFSANLEEIGTEPATPDANGVFSLDRVVFPQNRGVTDVYVLAHQVPKCYANAFPANMLYGWGGFKGGDFPYCREKYDNSADGSMIFTVLHFPDEASWDKASDKTGSSYEDMEKLYTDINKVYTKKEQTGAVDANGDPVAWPTFAELRRAYNQASNGITWNDWTLEPDENGEVVGGNFIPTAKDAITEGSHTNTYTFPDYEGWHQFVLSMATYVEPAKTIENEVIKTNYVQGAWYTLCIPFSLTYDQAVEMLGIPKSVEGKTENYLNSTLVTSDQIPDVRTLQTVTRTPGTTNTVTMKFTQSLVESSTLCRYWAINAENPGSSDYAGTGATLTGEKIAIRGGYPYLIRPYLPANEVVNNLGKYIMTRFSQELKQEMSCIYLDGCFQDLGDYTTNKTGRFAKPFENHKILAAWDDNDESTPAYRTHSDGKNYNYTFVGQFWDQKLPRYSFYMVENSSNTNGKWYRLASEKSYKWNQYKCIIMVTPEIEDAAPEGRSYLYINSGKFRNNDQTATTHSIYPASTGIDAQGGYKFNDHLYIEFLNGLDDANFEEPAGPAAARYVITFDDFIQELDEDGNSTTAIESLDGEAINKMPTNGKVYNLSGQLVGNSIDGLEKGMYIVNGKKYIVR